MRFTVLNWNIGGAKVLEQKTRSKREETRVGIKKALITLLTDHRFGRRPDVITFQEIVQWKEKPTDPLQELLDEECLRRLEKEFGYRYLPFPLFNSDLQSSQAKWNKVKENSDWVEHTFFAQGNAFLINKDAPHFPVWDLSRPQLGPEREHCIETVHLDSGLYFGDRNTEPRAALVAHFIYPADDNGNPIDIFVVNLHLTTLMMEREGVPEIDTEATEMRVAQLKIVFNGIVSRYNSWRQGGYLQRGKPRTFGSSETDKRYAPVWIIAGDFNFTEASVEYESIIRTNFIDTIKESGKTSEWGFGTKTSKAGNKPTLTLDYIFAGPQFVAFDPSVKLSMSRNWIIHDQEVREVSDHYPVLSTIEITPRDLKQVR